MRPVVAPPAQPKPDLVPAPAADLELEADSVADRFAHGPLDGGERTVPVPVTPAEPPGAGPPPRPVGQAIRSGGRPLDDGIRRGFEGLFGRDLDSVRIHDHPLADAAAASEGALAFTYGTDIGFRAGRFQPDSGAGRNLLAHELTHVVQQQDRAPRLQLKEDPETAVPARPVLPVRIYITSVMTQEQLLLEFIKQHLGAATDAEAAEIRDKEFPSSGIGRMVTVDGKAIVATVTEADVARGFVWFMADFPSIAGQQAYRAEYFEGLPSGEQDEIDAETDRLLGRTKEHRSLEELAKSDKNEDKVRATIWFATRDELVRQRQAIEDLPEPVRAFLFDHWGPPVTGPVDVQAALGIAARIGGLTQDELEEYRDSVNVTDWASFGLSVDGFLAELAQRRVEEAAERQAIKTKLHDLEALYLRYRAYDVTPYGVDVPVRKGNRVVSEPKDLVGAELEKDLQRAGFPNGIEEFGQVVEQYRAAFAQATVALTRIKLDQLEHQLRLEKLRYETTGAARQLTEAVAATSDSAVADFDESDNATGMAYLVGTTPMTNLTFGPYFAGKSARAQIRGEKKIAAAAEGHPLVQGPAFEKEALARAPGEAKALILQNIAKRLEGIAECREKLTAKPFTIYELPELFDVSLKAQGIGANTIYGLIARHCKEDRAATHILTLLGLAVISIVAGMFSFGTGTAAVLLGTTAFLADIAQVYLANEEYETKEAAYLAELVRDEPSLGWVILAGVGPLFSGGSLLGKALMGSEDLTTVLSVFGKSKTKDLDALSRQLKGFVKSGKIEQALYDDLIAAARTEAGIQSSFEGVADLVGDLHSVIDPAGKDYGWLVYAVGAARQRNIVEFDQFLKMEETLALIGDASKFGDESMAMLKQGYAQAIEEVEELAAFGKGLDSSHGWLLGWLELRSAEGMTLAEVKAEMNAMRASVKLADEAGGTEKAVEMAIDKVVEGEQALTKSEQVVEEAGEVVEVTAKSGLYGRFGSESKLQDAILAKCQEFTDGAYERALVRLKKLQEAAAKETPPRVAVTNENLWLGKRVDRAVRVRLKLWLHTEDIIEGPEGVVQVNRWLRNPKGKGKGYRVPDGRLGNLIWDVSLTAKTLSTAQVRGFIKYGNPTRLFIIRPSQIGESVDLLKTVPGQ